MFSSAYLLVFVCVASVFAQRLFDGSIACEPKPLSVTTRPNSAYGTTHGHRPPSTTCAANSASGAWWGSFAIPQGAVVTISTCNPYTNFETVISIYSGLCYELKCVTSSSQSNCTTFSWTSTGEITHVAVQGVGNQAGDFALTTSLSQSPPKSTCSAPIKVPLTEKGFLLLQGNLEYGSTGTNTPCEQTSTPVVWYSIETPSNYILHFEAGTCIFGESSALVQLSSGSCSSLKCADYENGCEIDQDLSSGTVYYFAITKTSNVQTSDYILEMNWHGHPPVSCQNPSRAYTSPYWTSSFYCDTAGGTVFTSDPCGKATGVGYWFQLSVPVGYNITASTCYFDTDPSFDTFLTVYSGSCSSLQCVAYNDDGPYCSYIGSSLTSLVEWQATESEYYVVISGVNGQTGEASLLISTENNFY